jgi:hypothetical protein
VKHHTAENLRANNHRSLNQNSQHKRGEERSKGSKSKTKSAWLKNGERPRNQSYKTSKKNINVHTRGRGFNIMIQHSISLSLVPLVKETTET